MVIFLISPYCHSRLIFARRFRLLMYTHFSWAWCLPFPDCLWCDSISATNLRSNFPWACKISYRAFSMRSKVRTYNTKIFLITKKAKTGWYDFSNVKSSKMLSFYSVAEAHGLIYPRPSGENFSFPLNLSFLKWWCVQVSFRATVWGRNAQWSLGFSSLGNIESP